MQARNRCTALSPSLEGLHFGCFAKMDSARTFIVKDSRTVHEFARKWVFQEFMLKTGFFQTLGTKSQDPESEACMFPY